MKITIDTTGCKSIATAKQMPSWYLLQTLIKEIFHQEDTDARLISIRRTDRGCDYRAIGNYEVTYQLPNGDVLEIDLTVK